MPTTDAADSRGARRARTPCSAASVSRHHHLRQRRSRRWRLTSAPAAPAPRGLGDEVVAVEALARAARRTARPARACASRWSRASNATLAPCSSPPVARGQRREIAAHHARALAQRGLHRVAVAERARLGARRSGSPRGPCRRRRTTSPASASASACRIAAARSGTTCAASGARMPARICAMIAPGSSVRGLSSVTITTSAAASAIAPISGRLPGSRSPPQPNTQNSRPRACARAASSTLPSASGRVRVVDEHQRLRAAAERLHAPRRRDAQRQRGQRLLQRHVPAEQHAEHGQQVLGVELADQPRAQRAVAPARREAERQALRASRAARTRGSSRCRARPRCRSPS